MMPVLAFIGGYIVNDVMAIQEEVEDTLGLAVFEVGLPADDPSQLIALMGLASAFHWRVREVPGEYKHGGSELVSLPDLRRVSTELYETDRYGQAAHDLLEHYKHDYRGTIAVRNLEVVFEGLFRVLGTHQGFIAPGGTADGEVVNQARSILEGIHPPCVFGFQRATDRYDFEKNLFKVIPLHVPRERLADFLLTNGLDGHELHGLLGKALDLLNSVAGIAQPKSTEAYGPEDFISVNDLVALAKEHDVTYDSMRSVKDRIMWALVHQMRTGKPDDKWGGEVVIEGNYDATEWYSSKLGPVLVAIDSLVQLGETAPRRSRSKDFLTNLPEFARQRF